MAAYIQLGKHGDILSILPILLAEYKETQVKPTLIVSREYSEIPLELNYVETVIWDGDWQDLAGAVKFAKQFRMPFFTPQTFGVGFPIQRKHPSFQLDQWDRCGRLHQWGKLPLSLPRWKQNKDNPVWCYQATIRHDKPYILFADHGQSSPFPHKEDLMKALQDSFTDHEILRASSLNFPRILDLLNVMDSAVLIVTVETMHLHLSAACSTPVIALVTDVPSRWHGSAYHPRMSLYVRYGDYPARKEELLHVAKRCVNSPLLPAVQVTKVVTTHPFSYNMSVCQHGDKLFRSHRYHPDHKSWRTILALECDGETLPISPPERYARHSHEDCRLFSHRGRLMASMTISRSRQAGQTVDPCVTGFGELVKRDGAWHIENWIEPRYGKNDWSGQEKNLVVFST